MDVIEQDLGLEAFGVCLHAGHQVGTGQAVWIARPVVHLGGGGQLTALLESGDQHRLEIGACCVDGGGVAGWAGAEDQQAGVTGRCTHGVPDFRWTKAEGEGG